MARDFAKAFYNSKEWQKCRDYVLRRDNYLCVRCGNPAEEVHHKKHLTPKNITDVSISLNPDNLICLCRDCHFAEHKDDKERAVARANKYRKKHRRVTEGGMYFDDNGVFMYRKVIVVYGSPRAGKNSYVKAHKISIHSPSEGRDCKSSQYSSTTFVTFNQIIVLIISNANAYFIF